MFCPNCGNQVPDGSVYCLGCGVEIKSMMKPVEGKVSAGWWWLGFFVPMVGFILLAVFNSTEPKKAKKCGWGALFGTLMRVVGVVLYYVAIIVFTFILAYSESGVLYI